MTYLGWEAILKAIKTNKELKIGDRIIHITPKLTKRDFLESLNDMGKQSEKEYFDYFGDTPMAIEMYPTIKGIKEEFGISYKELSTIGSIDLNKRIGHVTIDTTLKYYNSYKENNKNDKGKSNNNLHKELPSWDYLEFIITFEDNQELYEKLKPIKEKASCSWETLKNLKWKDIDLENKTIDIELEEIDIC